MQIKVQEFLPDYFFLNLKKVFYFSTFIISIFQYFISSFDLNVLIILILINLVSLFNLENILKKNNLIFYLIPSLLVLFVNLFYLIFPLFIKTFLGKKIFENLELPKESFFIAITYVLIANLSFYFFVKITNYSNKNLLRRDFLTKLNIFEYISFKKNLFIFFFLLIVKLYISIYQNNSSLNQEISNVFIKFLIGFDQLFYLPIIFAFNSYFYANEIRRKSFVMFILVNIILSIFFAILTNNRTEIFEMIIIIFFCFFIIFLQGKINFNRNQLVIICLSTIFFSLIIENISKKILDYRSIRYDISPIELFKITAGLSDTDYKIIKLNNYSNQEYIYTGYNILDRFAPIKHLDKALYDSSFFSFSDLKEFKEFSKLKMITFIPQNFVKVFNNSYNKSNYQIATGSKIERLSYHRFGGDFNKGSYIVELILLTESHFFSFLIISIIFIIFFFVITLFQKFLNENIFFSPIILLLSFEIIYISQADSISNFITFILRQPLQMILLINILLFFNTYSKKKI